MTRARVAATFYTSTQIQDALRGTAAETLSLADIIALAPAYGISRLGGGAYDMRVGRVDAASEDADVDASLPDTSNKLAELEAVRDFQVNVHDF